MDLITGEMISHILPGIHSNFLREDDPIAAYLMLFGFITE